MDHHLPHPDSIEPGKLLEDGWFFGNSLHRKAAACFSDPSSSSDGESMEETFASIHRFEKSRRVSLMRAPRAGGRRKSSRDLSRAPSLPATLETPVGLEDDEMDFSMGDLIRQASMNDLDRSTPRAYSSQGSRLSRQQSVLESLEKMPTNRLKPQKSLNDLENEEVQGFKDLGFQFDKQELSPKVISIIPGLQSKKREEENSTHRPYLSEAWQGYTPPVAKWGGERSTEDIKAQIKFWARAVASNVRQEC